MELDLQPHSMSGLRSEQDSCPQREHVQLALHWSRSCVNPRSAPCSSSCCPRVRRLNRRQPRRLRLRLWCPGSAWSAPPSSSQAMSAPNSTSAWSAAGGVARDRDGRGGAVGASAEAGDRLPARLPDPRLHRPRARRRRRAPSTSGRSSRRSPTRTRRSRCVSTSSRRSTSPGCSCCSTSTPCTRSRSSSRSGTCSSTRGRALRRPVRVVERRAARPSCSLRACGGATRYLGSPWATTRVESSRARAARRAERVPHPGRCARGRAREFIPIAIVAGTTPRDELLATYRGLLARRRARSTAAARDARRAASARRPCRSTRQTTGSISRSSGPR